MDRNGVRTVSRVLRNLQRLLQRKLPVLPFADHVPGAWIVRGTVFARVLPRFAFRQLRHVPTVSASVRRMRVAHQLHNVSFAVAFANRPMSYDVCPGVRINNIYIYIAILSDVFDTAFRTKCYCVAGFTCRFSCVFDKKRKYLIRIQFEQTVQTVHFYSKKFVVLTSYSVFIGIIIF